MNLIDKQDDATLSLRHLIDHTLQALLKLAFVLRTGHQRTHIQRIELLVLQVLRHITAHDTASKAFHDGGLTSTRLTDQDRVVLRTA